MNHLHDPDGTLQAQVKNLLAEGMIVVVDLSLVTGAVGLQISGLLLRAIFDHNQYSFTSADGVQGIIPTVAVLEEAQSVLGRSAKDESPFVQWAKEGRKYGLGAIMVTQQPGSMAPALLSQGDNFFTFHLLSANDLKTLQQHNAHFSDDILASILNEPIKGNCFFWSAPDQPFVLPARILDFNEVGTELADDSTSTPQKVRARQFESETRKAEDDLAEAVRQTITTTDRQNGVEFYNLPADHPDNPVMIACYKPRLSAQVAAKLDENARRRFCSADTRYVDDQYLDKALISSGLSENVQRVRARRNGRGSGDYYLIRRPESGRDLTFSGNLILDE